MNYYFDESGNWIHPERGGIVFVGGICCSRETAAALQQTFLLIKAEYGLGALDFHATAMSMETLGHCYREIAGLFESGRLKGLFRRLRYEQLRESRRGEEDVYLEHAADLVARLIAGDPNPGIEYDLAFYHNYPANVIRAIESGESAGSRYLSHFRKRYRHKEELLPKRLTTLTTKLRKAMQVSPIPLPAVAAFLLKLESPSETQRQREHVETYDWAELLLNFDSTERERERFRSRIAEKNRQFFEEVLSVEDPMRGLPIVRYVGKNEDNPGIQCVDILCNLLYRQERRPVQSPAAIRILEHLVVDDESR